MRNRLGPYVLLVGTVLVTVTGVAGIVTGAEGWKPWGAAIAGLIITPLLVWAIVRERRLRQFKAMRDEPRQQIPPEA